MKQYDILNSTSEHKIRVYGSTIPELFSHALRAMFDSMEPILSEHGDVLQQTITLSAIDQNALLVDFLSEALSYADAQRIAFTDVNFIELNEQSLKAELIGPRVVSFSTGIKAVTYHGVAIANNRGRFSVEILFDI